MADSGRVAVVTGGNRGLGLETCRQLARLGYRVVLTSRDEAKGRAAAAALAKEGLNVRSQPLAVTDADSVRSFRQWLAREIGRCDVLVNNAGVLLDEGADMAILTADVATLDATLAVNLRGPYLVSQALAPLMLKGGYGRVVNVSSGMGQLHDMDQGWPAYKISKTALNAFTRILADELRGRGVLVNAVCPGWVRTDMGGPNATRSLPQGADTIVWAATLPDSGPTGGFFRDRKPIEW